MLRLKVGDAPAEFRGAVLAMKKADSAIRRDISQRLRTTMNPGWRSEVNQHLTGWGPMEARMITAGAKIRAGNPPALVSADSSRKVGRGLRPVDNWAGYEYGASNRTSEVTNRKGKTYQRHAMHHLPTRRRRGRVLEPAVAGILPRIAAYWVQSVVRAFLDAAETRR